MLIKEAIEMLKRMNPNLEVTLQFKEGTVEQQNNEHLKEFHNRYGMDERDLHYRGDK